MTENKFAINVKGSDMVVVRGTIQTKEFSFTKSLLQVEGGAVA